MPRRSHAETVESLVNLGLEAIRFRSRESLIYARIPWYSDGHQSLPLFDDVGRAWLTRARTSRI
jgi:hypothetical protein